MTGLKNTYNIVLSYTAFGFFLCIDKLSILNFKIIRIRIESWICISEISIFFLYFIDICKICPFYVRQALLDGATLFRVPFLVQEQVTWPQKLIFKKGSKLNFFVGSDFSADFSIFNASVFGSFFAVLLFFTTYSYFVAANLAISFSKSDNSGELTIIFFWTNRLTGES